MSSLPDPSRIPDESWEFEGFSSDGLRRHYVYWIDREKGVGFRKTENLVEADLIASNQQSLNDSQGQRFGDGKIVSRIPLNVFYRDFAPRLKEGDEDYVKWWLNHDNNRPYRTFRGRV
jgi:hypothetical protein